MEYKQEIAEKVWTITHNLDTEPYIECWVDIDGIMTKIIPFEIVKVVEGITQITFLRPYMGKAAVNPIKTWNYC